MRWLWRGFAVVGLAVAVAVIGRYDARVRAYLAGPPLGGTRIYAAPTVLRPGTRCTAAALERRLVRAGYRAAAEPGPLDPGEFRAGREAVEVAQRPSPAPAAPAPRHVRIVLRGERVSAIHDLADGRPLDRVEIEPEVLALLGRQGMALDPGRDDAPPPCRAAVLAAEDRNYFRHPGVDPGAILRALIADLRAGEVRQGGSTITQQLVKNSFLSPRRSVRRKLEEALLSFLLEARTTKDDILARYLASVYLGTDGSLPVHGFAQGAEVYFGKPLAELGAAECALLAGLIRSPNRLEPRRNPEPALARRNRVLTLMVRAKLLERTAGEQAAAEPLALAPPRVRPVAALYVAAEVSRTLPDLLPREAARAPGLSVFTAIDAEAQREAEHAVRQGIDTLERRRRKAPPLEAALVALDPMTGHLRALVGGRHYGSSPLDRAVRAHRQPGSAFKPFVYLTALDTARTARRYTVVSPLDDTPLELRAGGRLWRPANYDHVFLGMLPLEEALADSRNVATVRLALDLGIDAVAATAGDFGIGSALPRVPALALGTGEATLLELAAAYGVLASGGVRRPPALITAVTSASAEVLYTAPREETTVVSPAVAYLVTHLLEQVIENGTGRGARAAGLRGAAAGKTGTTDDTRDAWFVGYTPEVIAGVWVGHDDNQPTGLTGAQGALPIWTQFVRAVGESDEEAFAEPEGIVWREVDPESGQLAGPDCPDRREEPFLAETAPQEACTMHRSFWTAFDVRGPEGDVPRGQRRDTSGRAVGEFLRRLFTFDW